MTAAPLRSLETDYLVIGAGAAGMAFTDALITAGNADVILVDQRHAPGGHWLDAYPFVRLHQPSAFYGVCSLSLGSGAIERSGPNAGFYEQASAAEICAYYDRVLRQHFLPSDRVRFFPMCRYTGDQRFVSRLSGEAYEVEVRKKVVDARYLETAVPSTSAPPFGVAREARCIPVNELTRATGAAGYTIVGAGKTAMDACVWLLQNGAAPSSIRWIKPRDAWLQNRAFLQGSEQIGALLEGIARQLEAAAQASSIDDLFLRLEEREQFLRVDAGVTPTMYRGPTLCRGEVDELRRIEDVVRLGKVRRIDATSITLDQGTIPTRPDVVHVHCATTGLNPAPEVPIFTDATITLQSIRTGLAPFAAAITGYIEATRQDTAEKNRLCPPNRQPNTPLDWARGFLIGMNADRQWSKQPDIADWLERCRLNPSSGLQARLSDPAVVAALQRFAANVRPGIARLMQLVAG